MTAEDWAVAFRATADGFHYSGCLLLLSAIEAPDHLRRQLLEMADDETVRMIQVSSVANALRHSIGG